MIFCDPTGRLKTSRRNFIKAGALTVNVNWPSVLVAHKPREKNPCCSI
jgi:hypothetical protein